MREGGSEGVREGGSEGGREVGKKGKWKRWRGEKNEATKEGGRHTMGLHVHSSPMDKK